MRSRYSGQRVNQLETRDIQRLYAAMQSQKSLSARIVRHTHAVLRQVLEQAVEWKLILRNPAEGYVRIIPARPSHLINQPLVNVSSAIYLLSLTSRRAGFVDQFDLFNQSGAVVVDNLGQPINLGASLFPSLPTAT